MTGHGCRHKIAFLVLLIVCAAVLQGCNYLRYRYDDAVEIFDLGFTFTKTPQFSAYMNCPVILPIGYGKVDGVFVGMGNGKAGVMKHSHDVEGRLYWGREKDSWDSFDAEKSDTLSVQEVGILGLAHREENAKPTKSMCRHYLHIGWVGVVWNVRWIDMPDFVAGIFGMDPLQDDGPDGGWWFGRAKSKLVHEAAEPPRGVSSLAAQPVSLSIVSPPPAPMTAKLSATAGAPAAPTETPAIAPISMARDIMPEASQAAKALEDETTTTTASAPSLGDTPSAGDARPASLRTDAMTMDGDIRNAAAMPASQPGAQASYTVRRGDTFWGIAERFYGDRRKWTLIFDANRESLGINAPERLRESATLRIPPPSK